MQLFESKRHYFTEKRIMHCRECHSESFVSASLLASKGQASANPLDWMPDFQSRVNTHELVDVLICQNCGQYHAVTNSPINGQLSLMIRLVNLGFRVNNIFDKRDEISCELTSPLETIIRPLRNLIVDYIHHKPGEFPRLSSSSSSRSSDAAVIGKDKCATTTTTTCHKNQPFLNRDGCAEFMTHESYGKLRIVHVFEDECKVTRVFGYAYYPTSYFYNFVTPTWRGLVNFDRLGSCEPNHK